MSEVPVRRVPPGASGYELDTERPHPLRKPRKNRISVPKPPPPPPVEKSAPEATPTPPAVPSARHPGGRPNLWPLERALALHRAYLAKGMVAAAYEFGISTQRLYQVLVRHRLPRRYQRLEVAPPNPAPPRARANPPEAPPRAASVALACPHCHATFELLAAAKKP